MTYFLVLAKIKSSISFLSGIEGVVPYFCTDNAATALANFTASKISFPSVSSANHAPLNASPAPVVSTAFTLYGGIIVDCSFVQT